MIIEAVIIAGIVSGTAFLGYIAKLIFMSKCKTCDVGCIHTTRETEQEAQNVSALHLNIPNIFGK